MNQDEANVMKVLSAADATVLALIAGNPGLSNESLQELEKRLSPEAQRIAKEIIRIETDPSAEPPDPADTIWKTAQAILRWVSGNKRMGAAAGS